MRNCKGMQCFCFVCIALLSTQYQLTANDTISIDQTDVFSIDTINTPFANDSISITDTSDIDVQIVESNMPGKQKADSYSTILTIDGKEYVVDINKESDSFLTFYYPLNKIERYLYLDIVANITYPDGTIKELNTPVDKNGNEIDSTKTWEDIRHTYKKEDIEGLYETGELYSRFESEKLKYKTATLEKSALIIMKRKAVRQNADIIIITDSKTHRGYGELPYIELWGRGYSYTK